MSDHASEILAAVLLAVTTVAAAWCAYQATRWGGVQAISFAEASTARVESSRAFNEGLQFASIDSNLFGDFAEAYAAGDTELQAFYVNRLFREEFIPVLDAWIATDPLVNPDAPRNPFVDEAYLDALFGEAEVLEARATAKFEEAKEANQTGDNYILNTVFFATVLFFAGVSTKFPSSSVKLGLLGLGAVIFVVVLVRLIGMPVY
jgi:hypothetical protein